MLRCSMDSGVSPEWRCFLLDFFRLALSINSDF